MIDNAKLMTQAMMLRQKLGEDNSSPIDVFALVQNIEGLTIVYYPMGGTVSGFCVKTPTGIKLIAVNSGMTMGRQRFSLAHELYHLYFDDNTFSACSKKIDTGKEIERSADMFASYFLMPDVSLQLMARQLLDKHPGNELSLSDVVRIEQYFGVSHQATIYRLVKALLITEETGRNYRCKAVRSIANSLGYSSDLYQPSPKAKQYMTYGYYIGQAETVQEHNLVSTGKCENLLMDAFRSDLVYGEEGEDGDLID